MAEEAQTPVAVEDAKAVEELSRPAEELKASSVVEVEGSDAAATSEAAAGVFSPQILYGPTADR